MSERSRESYRGTSLIARTFRSTVRGKAWCDGREIASIEGATEPEVIEALRRIVDEEVTVEAAGQITPYPPDENYERALRTHVERFSEKYLRMLETHASARGGVVTMRELAEAAGYPTLRAAYQQYSKIGRMLGESMLFEPRSNERGSPIWLLVLVEDEDSEEPELERRWRLRKPVREALKALGMG